MKAKSKGDFDYKNKNKDKAKRQRWKYDKYNSIYEKNISEHEITKRGIKSINNHA